MAAANATSSYGTYLMVKGLTYSSGSWSATSGTTNYVKLCDIKDYPDLGGEPELIETTTLSDKMQTNLLGVQAMETLVFNANYILDDFKKIKALEDYIAANGDVDFELWFGNSDLSSTPSPSTDATNGEFAFKGSVVVFPLGKGVNEVREMQISIANSTVINQLQ